MANASCEPAMPEPRDPVRRLFDAHYDFVWRSLRRLGVPEAAVDDAAQEVFMVAARRVDDIQQGSERSFLFGCALRIAAKARGKRRRNATLNDAGAERVADPGPGPAELLDRKHARELAYAVMERLPIDLRAVLALYELEGLTRREIANALEIPAGTVASRLRRAREQFVAIAGRLRARDGRMR